MAAPDNRLLHCLFVARPFSADGSDKRDFHVSVAMRFNHTTTPEDVVRHAFSHATVKLESTLTCPPQKILVFLRHNGILTQLPLAQRLVTISRFIDAASSPDGPSPVLLLTAPNAATDNVEKLTKAPLSPRMDAEHAMGFASFVRRPGPAEAEQPLGGESRPLSPLMSASVLSNTSFTRKGSSTGGPSELFIRHASEALRRNPSLRNFAEGSASPQDQPQRSPYQQEELPPLPLTTHVVYFSVFGERVEVEVPYLSTDPASSIIERACEAISAELVKPLDPVAVADMALHYRRKDGTELSFFGSRTLPLPKTTSPPTLFLARRHSTTATESPGRSPIAVANASTARSPSPLRSSSLMPSAPQQAPSPLVDPALEEMAQCRKLAAALKDEYGEAAADAAVLAERKSLISSLIAERDALLDRRKASQDRWTECATVTRDVERLREQLAWFEREATQLRDRETSLTLKLHRLELTT